MSHLLHIPERTLTSHSEKTSRNTLTCFAVLRLGFPLPSRVDRNHGDSVVRIWLQVLQHGVVGSAWNLDLESRPRLASFCTIRTRNNLTLPVWLQDYRLFWSSGCRDVVDLVLAHVALSGVPFDIESAGGGVRDLQVPNAPQRL